MTETATLVRMEHQAFISFADILAVSIECPSCRTRISVPVSHPLQKSKDNHSPLGKCPACHGLIDYSLHEHINELTSSLRALVETRERHNILIQIRQTN